MATRKCKDCGNQVSKRAKQCPHCGAPAKKKSGCLGVIGLLFLVAVVIGIISSVLDDGSSPPPAQPAAAPKPKDKPKATPPPSTEPKAKPEQPQPTPEPAVQPEPAAPDWKARQAELKTEYLPEFRAPTIGARISLKLKGGSTQEGVIKSLTPTEIQIEGGGATLGFTQAQLSTASRVRCFASDYATYKAYKQTKEEKDAFEARERARVAEIEAKRKAEESARLAAARKKRIESGFSSWDGSHIKLTRVIKDSMNDPKSYKHAETGWWDMGDHLVVKTSFRGKNAFGGTVLNWVKAKCDLDGNVIEVIEQGP